MAKKWEEVASNPEYQNLSSSEKEDVRKEYFENVVKPNVPSEDLAKAQKDFDQFSNPSAARKAINAIKSGVTLFKDAAYDAIDNRTLSEKGLLTSKESDENAMSRKVPGVPLRVDYFDKLKQQDRIAPKSIDAMAGTKGATARAADTVIAERPFNADVNQGTNDAIYGEPQKQIPFDERKREERRLEAEAKAKLFTESLKQAGETRSADQALQQAVNQKPSHEEVTNVANQIAHKEEMQAMYGDIPKPEGMDVATNAAGRAVKTGSALAQNMIAFGSSVVNADDLALKFLQSAAKTQDEAGQYPAALKDFTEIQSWSDVPTYALEGVIENAPMLVGSIGSGALGAFTAKNLGKNKLAKLTQEAAVKELAKRATIGATVGAGTASIGMESGSIFGDIYRETGEQRTALAAAGGIVAGAFDAIPAVMALKTALGGKVGEEAAKTIIKRYGVDGLKQIGAEGGTEFAQTWVEEIAKARASGNDVLSQQNLINSLDAMFKGGAAGGVTHIAAQGFNDLTTKKVEKFKTLPNENLQRLRSTAEKAMPQDVPLIDAEIQRRANTPTLQRAVEAGMREGGITQPAETLPASDILENENDGISDATSILATETDGLGLDNTEGSRGDIPETTGSGTVSDWIIDSTRPLEQGDGGDLSVRGNDSEGQSDITLNDVTAHAAATSDLNDTPQPTEAQKEAGNYKKGSVKISGMDISIENPHTSTRSGVDKDGTAWENQQNGHYGYIKGVVARAPDKEHVDVNVKPNTAEDYAGDVFVINQNHPDTGKFDEPKVYIGYEDSDSARAAYYSNYQQGWNGLGSISRLTMDEFKSLLNDKDAFKKPIHFGDETYDAGVMKTVEETEYDKPHSWYNNGYKNARKLFSDQPKTNTMLASKAKTPQQITALIEEYKARIPKLEKEVEDNNANAYNRLQNAKGFLAGLTETIEKGNENGLQKQGQKAAQKVKKQTPKVNSLLSKIFNLGGITSNDKLDVTGQDKSFAPGGYNKIFKKQSRQSLRGLIENGDLDEFLPHNMRVSSITQDSDAYDSAEAYDYLADKIRAGEKVLPYEAQQEIEQNKFQENLTAEEHVDLVAETLTEDQINEQFRIAANEEREASILATDFIPDNEDGVIESSQREAIGKQTEPQTVTSQEREGVRPIVEAIAKRRAAANQINKAKAFDVNLQLAKDFMAGKDVKPVKFTTAATLFNKDSVLNESFNKLAEMAKAPAKEARAEKANTIEAYKQRIAEAKTADALQTIAGEIQRDSALSDTQAQALDDIVFDAQDKFETSEPEAESLTVQTRRKELENAQGIWAKEPSSLVKIALVRQAEKKLNEALEISNDVNAETTNDSDINKQSSKQPKESNPATPAADLLGDNTAAKQAIADVERAKDAKRNEGIADTEGFTLTGSNSEADKATAMGAQDLFAQPKDETPTNQDEVNYNGVRLYKIKVRNRIEGQPPTEMWAVESLENKARKERGERALGGDTLSESLEEAKSEADLMLKRDAENKQAQALQNEYDNAQQEQARTEAEKKSDIDGFGAELNAMQLGKLKETLNKPTSIKGEVLPLRDTVQKLVAQGGKPEIKEENVYKGMSRAQYNRADNRTQQEDEKRIRDGGKKNVYYITMPDGGMYDLGKTAHDFAEHLISKKNSDVEEEKPQLELTGNELTKKSGALKDTSDVGIEMLGNRRNKGLTLNDIQNADNDTERVAMAVKNKLWEKPDYQALVDSGIQPVFAHIVKQVYDSLSTKPAYKGEKMLYDYVNTVEAAKKAVDELLSNNTAMAEMTIAIAVKARQSSWMMNNSINELGGISKEIKANENALNFLVDRVFPKNENGARWGSKNKEGNDKANATGNRFYKNISLDLSSFVDAIKAVEQGFPAKQEAWERSYQIKEKDGKFQVIKKGRFTPKSEHATHEEAVNAARELVKRQREEQFKEPETPVEKSVRKGREIRTQGNVSSQELKETIGLKAVNFGDWMKQTSNAKERQEHVNSAFDAFHDLAEVINVPVKAMSLDGMLGLAIGAQGKGKHAAHFYPGYNEINLTREKGAGSLAHEWAHGLDHYFGVKAGLATRDNPFASWIGRYSNLPDSNIRKEVADAFNAIVKTMRDTTETVDAAKARIEATAKASKDRLNSYIERNGLKDAVKDDAKAQSALDAIIAGERGEYIEWPALKGKRKPQGFTSEHVKVLADKLGWNFDRAYDLNLTLAGHSAAQEALKIEPELRKIHTEYYREASRLDAGKKDAYWTTPHELFARAFEMYVADKIANADGRNDYLVAAWKQAEEIKTGNAFADEILNEAKKRYPQGNERKAINDAFDVLFKEIQTKESDDGNVVMFSRSKSTQQIYENRIDDLFADGKADFKGTGVKVLDKSDMLNLLGYGDKPVYLSENKVQQGKYNHGLTAEHWKKIPEWLDDPALVFDSDTVTGRLVFIAPELLNGAPIRIIVDPDATANGLKINLVVNAYDAKGKLPFGRWVKDGLLRFYSKAKSLAILARSGLQLSSMAKARSSNGRIYQDSDLVNYKNEDIRFSQKPIFYSALTRAVDEIKINKAPVAQWKAIIKNLAQKGVKPDEIEWTGVNEWLDLQEGQVTKEQVMDYLNANGVQVSETMLGSFDNSIALKNLKNAGYTFATDLSGEKSLIDENGDDVELDDLPESLQKDFMSLEGEYESLTSTKYSQYTVPGGTNYKELLLTLPKKVAEFEFHSIAQMKEFLQNNPRKDLELLSDLDKLKQLNKERRIVGEQPKQYRSSHFEQPNILAHIRFDERTDAEGNKVLFINEIQSDWGQEGKKKGFVKKEPSFSDAKKYFGIEDETWNKISDVDKQSYVNEIKERGRHITGIQDAPFVTKTDAWVSLALKRMIRYASENSFDKVAIINGKQAGDLYSLAKQVDEIIVEKLPDGTFNIKATLPNGGGTQEIQNDVRDNELEGLIGKDLAKKVVNQDYGTEVYDGGDLEVGNEGMIGFYDKIVPKVAKDVLKKLGGNVEEVSIKDPSLFRKGGFVGTDDANVNQTGFSITPEMREKIMGGLPLFAQGNKKVGMPIADVEKEVKNFSKGWKRIPQVIVVDSMQDERINEHVRNTNKQMIENGATGLPIGFISQGKVYILAPMVKNKSDIATVMMHEIFGHAGLRANFGTKLDDILEQIYITRRKEVLAKAKQYGYDFTKHADRLKAAEEVLAEMAQTNPQLGFVKRAIAAIRAWLRANIPYYKNLEITDEDIIGNILIPARNFILKGETGGSDLGLNKVIPVFSRTNQTNTPEFKKWFGKSKVVDADGKPLVVYHGTTANFESFDNKYFGKGKGSSYKGKGNFFFTDAPLLASDYAKAQDYEMDYYGASPNVIPAYLNFLNPLTVDAKGMGFGAVNEKAVLDAKKNGNDGVIIKNVLDRAGDYDKLATTFIAFEPNQIKSAIGNNGNFDGNNNDIRFSRQGNITPEWGAPEASKIDSLIYTLQDKHIDLKRVTENIKNVGNHIDDRWNAYLQEELYHGRAAKRTQDFIKHELEPLIKDMQERKVAMADFEEYLWMRHAPERNKKMASINEGSPDGLAGVSTKDAKEYLANLTDQQKLDFEALAERIDAINKASEQVLIDYGLESTDTIAKWNSAYEYYVPLMREEMENGSGPGTGQGFSVKGNASKRATGSKRAVVDIIANIAQQRERYIIRGEKNRVSTALIGLAKLNPNEEFWRTDTPPTKKDVSKITGMVEEYTDPNYKNRDNVIVARIPDKLGKIQERSVIFNEFDDRAMRMARSLKNLDQDQLHEVLGTASIITRYFSSINTQYNPIFGVINLLRDTQTAAINLSSTPLKGKQKEVMSHVLLALKGIYSDLRSERESGTMPTNEYAILFEEFQKEGGQTGYRDMYRNAKERSAAIEHALDHEWWTKTKIGKAISANGKFAAAEVWMNDKAVKPIFNWLSDYNEAMENAVRLSAYKVAIDNWLSKQQAASIAKNISVNFNRKGEMGRQIGSLYAFFNASVQGTARIADTLLKNDDGKYSLSKTGKTIVKGGLLLGVMQALLLAAAGYSDDDPPAYSKDRNLIIPLDIFGADNKYATIALPLGFNAIPAFSRHITEWALSGGEDTHDRVIQIIDMILNVTNPIGNAGLSLQTALPTLADPLAAIAENKDFTGRDISRKDFNQLDPTPGFTRSRDKAWDVSIAVARAMNWASGGTDYQPGWASPTADQIEYLAGQVTGGVGREIIKAGTTVDALISGEDLPSYKIPLLGRFYGDAASQSSQGAKFYKNITELNKIENELKGRAKNHEDVNSFKENNPEYRAIVTARISLEQVQNLRKRQRAMVEKGEDKEKIKDIDEKITMIMTRLNTKVEDYRSQANE